MSPNFEIGSIVWVRLGQKWWPGRVSSLDECPVQYTESLKKTPLAIVKFFNESEFHDVTKAEHIFPYSCSRKNDIIRKGLNSVKYDSALGEKFEADIAMAEKLTGGNMDIVKELRESTKPTKIDYSDLGFGTTKPKKKSKDQCMQRRGFSDIAEAIQYKRGFSPLSVRTIEHKVKIMEQPKMKPEDDMKSSANWFKCYTCGFTCGRLNVIIWHNKAHLKKVADYDSGIRIPGRRKRRRKTQRNKDNKMRKGDFEAVDHAQTNGHATPKRDPSGEASQLLADWDDDDDDQEEGNRTKADTTIKEESTTVNGVDNDENEVDSSDDGGGENDSDDDDYDEEYPRLPKGQRQPMPKQVDINSAFDALLAESSPLHKNNQNSSYANNDSDSECSDWEKYYAKSGEEDEGNESTSEENKQNGHHHSQTPKTQSRRSKRASSSESSDEVLEKKPSQSSSVGASSKAEGRKSSSNVDHTKKVKSRRSRSRSPQSPRKSSKNKSNKDAASPPVSPGPSISKSSSPLPERTREEQSEEHSSSSSTSSGPAYMLVAVDAHGNNVPMPVLSEGGNHLVAVEASMEDGTTRTLYIDPAHLGPNVDLNNLMLHIDNSGQETVIIPTSTADGEIISSTLVEQPVQDSDMNPVEEKGDDHDEGKNQLQESTDENTESSKVKCSVSGTNEIIKSMVKTTVECMDEDHDVVDEGEHDHEDKFAQTHDDENLDDFSDEVKMEVCDESTVEHTTQDWEPITVEYPQEEESSVKEESPQEEEGSLNVEYQNEELVKIEYPNEELVKSLDSGMEEEPKDT